jgi:hypothetical protein
MMAHDDGREIRDVLRLQRKRMTERRRAEDDEREMREALRLEPFVLGGVNQLVKVLPLSEGVRPTVSGYVTQERFLLGRTAADIERALGLPFGSLRSGCRVLRLQRQPGPSEVVYELTTKYPDGLAHTALSDRRYPSANKGFIHQWRLTKRFPATLLCQLSPDMRYTISSRR